MNKYGLLLFFYFVAVNATDLDDNKTDITVKNKEHEDKNDVATELLPDKELLLFLSEFTDAQGDWVDPEVFNQTEITNSNNELEETRNEDRPNSI